MIKNSCRCGGIIESSDSTCRAFQRVRRSLLQSFVYIKTSFTNGMIMRPSASASTRCWRNTPIGEHMCLEDVFHVAKRLLCVEQERVRIISLATTFLSGYWWGFCSCNNESHQNLSNMAVDFSKLI